MNDNEFRSTKLLKSKYRRGHQIIQTFCKIGSPQKLGPPSLICRYFKTLRKVLLNHAECMRSNEWRWIWIHKTFKIEIQKGGPNNSDFLQNWFLPEIRSPLHLFLEILGVWEQYSWIMQNGLKSNEWRRIWVCKTFKIEIQKGGPNNSDFLQNWFPPEIRSPFFNL